MALNALQYEEIIKDYEKLRDKNRHLLEYRREEVYAKLPGSSAAGSWLYGFSY